MSPDRHRNNTGGGRCCTTVHDECDIKIIQSVIWHCLSSGNSQDLSARAGVCVCKPAAFWTSFNIRFSARLRRQSMCNACMSTDAMRMCLSPDVELNVTQLSEMVLFVYCSGHETGAIITLISCAYLQKIIVIIHT